MLKINSKELEIALNNKSGYKISLMLIRNLSIEEKEKMKEVVFKVDLEQIKAFMKRFNNIVKLLEDEKNEEIEEEK